MQTKKKIISWHWKNNNLAMLKIETGEEKLLGQGKKIEKGRIAWKSREKL